ncbi:hypothetical protein J43TS3_14780 [Ornithinibacillus bavariensis]|uniref:Uncharacterized protein n=1 Tax=Ornithinibacillus bavariensis TaxID=545502 RepID=A0A919X6K6_9BACI|nr:hypothetical protein J43TS3_14780 [Ornithinibacillus bavariensis]
MHDKKSQLKKRLFLRQVERKIPDIIHISREISTTLGNFVISILINLFYKVIGSHFDNPYCINCIYRVIWIEFINYMLMFVEIRIRFKIYIAWEEINL